MDCVLTEEVRNKHPDAGNGSSAVSIQGMTPAEFSAGTVLTIPCSDDKVPWMEN